MRIGKDLLHRVVNLFHSRFGARVLVLLYHRVVNIPSDPQLLSVSPQHFGEHLEILSRYARPMRLRELITALYADILPRCGVVITFDDGYIDTLKYAKPMLESHNIPATVFFPTGKLGNESEFWWDELERLFLQPGELPHSLSLSIYDSEFEWSDPHSGVYTNNDYERFRNWNIEESHDPTPRHKLYRSMYQILHSMDEIERQPILEKLQIWSGKHAGGRPSHRALTANELILLDDGDLIEIGAHTVTHPALGGLSASRQREEIIQSRACLENVLNRPIDSFAYPHGSYTNETVSLVQEAGFHYACSSETDAVRRGANVFTLPRVVVRDWDGDEFSRWFKGWLGI